MRDTGTGNEDIKDAGIGEASIANMEDISMASLRI